MTGPFNQTDCSPVEVGVQDLTIMRLTVLVKKGTNSQISLSKQHFQNPKSKFATKLLVVRCKFAPSTGPASRCQWFDCAWFVFVSNKEWFKRKPAFPNMLTVGSRCRHLVQHNNFASQMCADTEQRMKWEEDCAKRNNCERSLPACGVNTVHHICSSVLLDCRTFKITCSHKRLWLEMAEILSWNEQDVHLCNESFDWFVWKSHPSEAPNTCNNKVDCVGCVCPPQQKGNCSMCPVLMVVLPLALKGQDTHAGRWLLKMQVSCCSSTKALGPNQFCWCENLRMLFHCDWCFSPPSMDCLPFLWTDGTLKKWKRKIIQRNNFMPLLPALHQFALEESTETSKHSSLHLHLWRSCSSIFIVSSSLVVVVEHSRLCANCIDDSAAVTGKWVRGSWTHCLSSMGQTTWVEVH